MPIGQNSGVRHVWTDAPGLCVLCWKWACSRSWGRSTGHGSRGCCTRGGAGNFAMHGVEEVINVVHGVEVAPDTIYTRGVVLSDDEAQMLGLVITIEDTYIGPHFVRRLTPTNITSKFMKIPMKIVQPLNLALEGVIGLCMGVGDLM
ncbi:hypothetical protein ACQJBY_071508 [Aegilops geniculata]